MTTNFNFTRFTNLLKLDIAENWKTPFWFVGYLCRFPHPYAGMVVESFRIQLSSVLQQYAGSRFSGNQFFLHILCFPHHDLHEQQGEAYLIPAASGHDV